MEQNVKFTKKSRFLTGLLVLFCSILLCLGTALFSSRFFDNKNSPETVFASVSGTCGTGVNWTLDDGVLTISGNGVMTNYGQGGAPWYDDYSSSITSIVIENGVTRVGSSAFYGLDNLESIEIADSVTIIGDSAFYDCGQLKTVTIPNTLTSIGNSAFFNCESLKEIVIPKGVTSSNIKSYAFRNCYDLETVYNATSLSLSRGSTSYGYVAYYADRIVTLNGGDFFDVGDYKFGVKNDVYYLAGYHGTNTSLVLPSSFEYNGNTISSYSILNYAFYSNDDIVSVKIPSSVTGIGAYAFQSCASLTSIELGNNVSSIGTQAFSGCSNLDYIYNLSSLSLSTGSSNYGYIAYYADKVMNFSGGECFFDVGDYAFGIKDGEYYLIAYTGTDSDLVLPSSFQYNSHTVSSYKIYDRAFYQENITSVEIPSNVKGIGQYAFYNCSNLSSIVIPNSVTTMESYVFAECSSLTSATIGTGLTSIPSYAFQNSGLTEVTLSNGLETISTYAFNNCDDLKAVTIPDSVMVIGSYAFNNCNDLGFVSIGTDVTTISTNAFRYCYDLEKIYNFSGLTFTKGSSNYGYIAYYAIKVINFNNGYFFDVGDYTFENRDGNYYLVDYRGTDSDLVLPSSFDYEIDEYVFYSNTNITSVTIPNNVTVIGNESFGYCNNLASITIGTGLTSIAQYAFSNHSKLKTIYNSSSLSFSAGSNGYGYIACYANKVFNFNGGYFFDVGDYKFVVQEDDYYLVGYNGTDTDLVLPSSFEYDNKTITSYKIYDRAFYQDGITSIEIPGSVTSIGASTFYGCSNLTSVTLGTGLTNIDSYAFSGCNSLTSIEIPNSVTSIGESAFSGCSNLASVTLGTGLTSIPSYAFQNSGLTEIIIPNNVESIGNSAFSDCSNLLSVTLGTGLTNIDSYAFSYCSNLTSIEIQNSVTSIGESAFSYCSNLTSVTFGIGLTSIGSYAFSSCNSLTSIEIPNSVKTIGQYAFYYCSGLTSVTFGAGLTTINDNAFSGCSSLEAIVIPNSVKTIGQYIFQNCTSLTSVTLGSGLTKISYDAFYGCSSLEAIVIPDGVIEINGYAFQNCTNLTSVTLGSGLTKIDYRAFYGCTSLEEIVIPDGVIEINGDAFTNCTSLTSVTLGSGLTRIESSVFENCTSLEEIVIPNSVTSIESNAFQNCTNLTSVAFGSRLTSIGYSAFKDCVNLTSIEISSELSYVGGYAFQNCSNLTGTITLDTSVTSIYYYAFDNCPGLTIKIKAMNAPSKGTNTFGSGENRVQKILVPNSSVSAYKIAWPEYEDIIEGMESFYYATIAVEGTEQTYTAAIDEDEKIITLVTYTGSDTDIVLKNRFVNVSDNNVYEDYTISFKTTTSTSSGFYPSSTTSFTIDGEMTFIGSFRALFARCEYITAFDFGDANTTGINDMSYMFYRCGRVETIDVSMFDTSNVVDMSYMFNCYYESSNSRSSQLRSLDLTNFNTSKVTNMEYMFYRCGSLKTLDVSMFDTSNVTNMRYMFACDIGTNNYAISYLEEITFSSKFDTSKVTNMSQMFYGLGSLKALDLSSFNSSSLTDVNNMFLCINAFSSSSFKSELKSLTFGENFTLSKVTNMSMLFFGLNSLEELDLSMFDTSNVTDMSNMFAGDLSEYLSLGSSLKKIDLSSFDTSKVTRMSGMFAGCTKLKELDLSNFDTSNVTDMRAMFYRCSSLMFLDLSSFDLSSISSSMTGNDNPFYNCNNLKLIYLPTMLNQYSEAITLPGGEWIAAYDGATGTTLGSFNMLSSEFYKRAIAKRGYEYGVEDYYMWFRDYDHVFDKQNKTLTLTRYNGSDVNIFIDGSLSYLGVRYKVILDVGEGGDGLFEGKTFIETIRIRRTVYAKNISRFVYGCSSLKDMNLSGLDLSELEEGEYVFTGASAVETMFLPRALNTYAEGIELPSNLDYSTNIWVLASDETIKGITFGVFKDNLSTSIVSKAAYIDGLPAGDRPEDVSNWYEDYVYTIDTINHTITLSAYIGDDKDIEVEARTYLGNEWYTTYIAPKMFYQESFVESVRFKQGVVAIDLSYMFSQTSSIKSVDLRGLDTSAVTDMSYMFGSRNEAITSSIEEVIFTGIDTSNVTDMSYMFTYCGHIEEIDLSGLDTSKVENMTGMFGCLDILGLLTKAEELGIRETEMLTNKEFVSEFSALKRIDLTNIDTSSVTNMTGMFAYCPALEELDLSMLDTSSVTEMGEMFMLCTSLEELDLGAFDTSKVTDMDEMFIACVSLERLNLTSFDTSSVKRMDGMFMFCSSFESIDLSSFDLSGLTDDVDGMFAYCTKLTTIYLPQKITKEPEPGSQDEPEQYAENSTIQRTENVDVWVLASDETITGSTFGAFKGHLSGGKYRRAIYLQGSSKHGQDIVLWYEDYTYESNAQNKTITLQRYNGSDTQITIYSTGIIGVSEYSIILDVGSLGNGLFQDKNFITSIEVQNGVVAKSLKNFAYGCTALETADLSGLNTTQVTNILSMFENCSNLKTLNMSSFDLSNITNANRVFANCNKLEVIYLPMALNATSRNIALPTNTTYGTNTWVLRIDETKTGTKFNDFATNLSTRLTKRAIYIQGLPEEYRPYDIYLWYLDYEYVISDGNDHGIPGLENVEHLIGLIKYIGMEPDVFVPATTNINGVEYKTVFGQEVYRDNNVIESISVEQGVVALDLRGFFYKAENLQTVDLRGLDTSRVTNMQEMFIGCGKLEYIDMSGLNTSNVTNMSYMFACGDMYLAEDIVIRYDGDFTSQEFVEEIMAISSLRTVLLTGFDTSNVTDMSFMFVYCTALESIDISMFDTSKVEDMDGMFGLCASLKTLNLSNFNTSQVRSMRTMFAYCYDLEVLDISSFDMSAITNLNEQDSPFLGGTNLKKIITPQVAIAGISLNKILYGAQDGQAYTTLPLGGSKVLCEIFEITFVRNNGLENFVVSVISSSTIISGYEGATRLGYNLVGWFNDSTDGEKVVDSEGKIVPDTVVGYVLDGKWDLLENKTLYARWELINYTITYDLAGGEAENPITYTILTETFSLNEPTKQGLLFVGWTGSNGEEVEMEVQILKGSTGDKNFVAHWISASFTLTFHAVGGQVNPESKQVVYGEAFGELPTPTKDGYDFAGWFTMIGEGEEVNEETILSQPKNMTIYAHWLIVEYEIQIRVENETRTIYYTIESENITLENPAKTGYKFLGWTGTNLEKATVNLIVRKGSFGDRVYLANFEPIIYIVTLNANGGSCGTKFMRMIYQSVYKVLPQATRKGYKFAGWFDEISDGNQIEPGMSYDKAENSTIYAHWTIESFVITYDANYDDIESVTQSVQYNTNFTTYENTLFEREGYEFIGWSSKYGEYFDSNTEYIFTDDENITLYAIWQKKGSSNNNVVVPILIGLGAGIGGLAVVFIILRIVRKRRFNRYQNS